MKPVKEIREAITNLEKDRDKGYSLKKLEQRNNELKNNNPQLFKLIVDNDILYQEGLERMLKAAEEVERGDTSREEMDKKVGFELAKEYIYPHIDMEKELN